jgi:hypothetical protein
MLSILQGLYVHVPHLTETVFVSVKAVTESKTEKKYLIQIAKTNCLDEYIHVTLEIVSPYLQHNLILMLQSHTAGSRTGFDACENGRELSRNRW